MDDSGQFPIGMPGTASNDELDLVMSGDRYLAFIDVALRRFRQLSEGRAALFRGDLIGGATKLRELGAEVIGGFQRDAAEMARFRANLQTSTTVLAIKGKRGGPLKAAGGLSD